MQFYRALDGNVSLYKGDNRVEHVTPPGGCHFHVAVSVAESRRYNKGDELWNQRGSEGALGFPSTP